MAKRLGPTEKALVAFVTWFIVYGVAISAIWVARAPGTWPYVLLGWWIVTLAFVISIGRWLYSKASYGNT